MTTGASPFPFASLPAVSRDEIRARSRVRDVATSLVRLDVVTAVLAELVGEPVTIAVRRARSHGSTMITPRGIGVLLGPVDAPALSRAALIDVEPALAAALLTRALRQRAPRVIDGAQASSAEVAGALAALLHAAARRADLGAPLRVIDAGAADSLAGAFAGTHAHVATAWLGVVIGGDTFDARVTVPLAELPPVSPTFSRGSLDAMDDAPIALPLVAASCLAERSLLSSLGRGDVFVVPGFSLTAAGAGRNLVGNVALVGASSERGIQGVLGEDGRLVLRSDRLESHSWDPRGSAASDDAGETMSGEPNKDLGLHHPTLEAIEDAPVVVRIELGVVEMKAREWASLADGDVVTLGRKLGDPAVLRVGGVEVARGELVQVDGEYGVRILGRSGANR